MWKTFSIGESAFCRRTVLRVGALWPYVLPVGAAFGGGGGGKMCMRRNYRRGVVRFHYSSVLLLTGRNAMRHTRLRSERAALWTFVFRCRRLFLRKRERTTRENNPSTRTSRISKPFTQNLASVQRSETQTI